MIASSSFGSGFGALGTYLVADADRVGWAETRNMSEGMDLGDGPTPPDPRVVAAEMGDRATRSRAAEPMYHVVVAFDPDDQPTEAEVREAADRTLRDLGLEHHQALLVRHTDRPHAHVHLMVNRVGEDGRAWSPWRQRTRLRASMEAQERELGVRWTGRNRDLGRDANAPPDQSPVSPTRAFAAEVRAKALGDLREAGSWGELDARLAAHGLQIERRGQGGVVTDGTRETTLSSVSRTVSRPRLEARLGPLRGGPGDRTPTAGLAAGAPTPPASARADAASRDGAPGTTTPRKRGRPRLSTPPRSSASMRARRAVLDGRLSSSLPPAATRSGGRSGPVLRGSRFARRGLAALRGDPDGNVERRLTRTAGRATSLAARTLARRATHRDLRPGGRVDRLAALVAERGRVVRLGDAQDHARSVGTNVTARVNTAAREATAQAGRDRTAFADALGRVYRDPQAAAERFVRLADRQGPDAAARAMAERPERFGILHKRGKAFGLGRSPSPAGAAEAGRAGAAYVGGDRARRVAQGRADLLLGTKGHPSLAAAEARSARTARGLAAASGAGSGRAALREIDGRIARAARRVGRVPSFGTARTGAARVAARNTQRATRALAARVGTVGVRVVTQIARSAARSLGRE